MALARRYQAGSMVSRSSAGTNRADKQQTPLAKRKGRCFCHSQCRVLLGIGNGAAASHSADNQSIVATGREEPNTAGRNGHRNAGGYAEPLRGWETATYWFSDCCPPGALAIE